MLKEGLSIDTTFNPPLFSSDYTFKAKYVAYSQTWGSCCEELKAESHSL
jgi:hypothetical protein